VLLGVAHRHLAGESRCVGYMLESAFPVYILHQPAIVVVGYLVVAGSLGITAKFFLIASIALVVTLAVYHFAVRRWRLLRFLTGMKTRAVPASARLSVAGAAVLLAIACALAARADVLPPAGRDGTEPSFPLGLWWAEGGAAQVELRRCDDELCGRVVWLRSPFGDDGCDLRDEHNPDVAKRTRPVLGMDVLAGLKRVRETAGEWTDGSIYDPGSGNTYRCQLSLKDDDTVELRGYVGIPLIGRTTRWFRVGAPRAQCEAR
jgi:uncharacterized protein (DUF2147 family)